LKSHEIEEATEKLERVASGVFPWYGNTDKYTTSIHMADWDNMVLAVFRGRQIAYLISMYADGSGKVSTYMPSIEYGFDGRPYVITDRHTVRKVPNFSPETVDEIRKLFNNEHMYDSMEDIHIKWVSKVNSAMDKGMTYEEAINE
jgi:hypothetical protein